MHGKDIEEPPVGFAIQTPKIILLNFLPNLSLNMNETDSAVKAKKASKTAILKINQKNKKAILKAKKALKWIQTW